MSLAPGSKLGPYEILGQIGAGGMGEVYRAKDPRLAREVAIKVLPATYSQDAERLRRFEQEAKAAGVLNHPNITAVYDIGTARRRRALRRPGASRGRDAARGARRRPHRAAPRARLRDADRPRPRRGAREGHRPSGPEARERLRHEGRPRQDPRLRPREADAERERSLERDQPPHRDARHRARRRPRNARLHVARAGPRQARRRAQRHLLLRRDPLRDALGQEGVPRRLGRGHDVGDPQGGSAGSLRHQPEHLPRSRAHRPPLHREESRAAVPVGARSRLQPGGRLRDIRCRAPRRPFAGGSCGLLPAAAARARRCSPAPRSRSSRCAAARTDAADAPRRRDVPPSHEPLRAPRAAPSLSPDGQTVAFVHRSGGKTDVWVQRAGGRNPIDLTPDCDRDSYTPAFSPDGSLIAYGSQCGEGGLFLMGATGENCSAPDELRQRPGVVARRPRDPLLDGARSGPLRPPGDERDLGDRRRQREDAQALRRPRRHPARRLPPRPARRLLGPAGRRRSARHLDDPVQGARGGRERPCR